ncbi:MAG: purine-nucleoside phosphorylase [Spirochaetaceae bacterium]|nr:purine-nucleoside phosphorylase [Spirochaetaceae bacterium]MBO7420284.1 purine-nucleoside phosphorylase [Spirochaetaceae bacterium]MBP5794074.1 purine-nucleoside phosphorylase [Spirochaetaceae bacterium]
MSTPHNNAKPGDIAEAVLLPGDPKRAEYIAKTYLENPVCYNQVRGMLGFTGTYKGKRVSVQGTGMGQPSLSIYVTELFRFYDVKKAIRVGTCGSVNKDTPVRSVILATAASTDSAINTRRFNGMHFAPAADFELLKSAYDVAKSKDVLCKVGTVVSSDIFYDDAQTWKLWAEYGVLGIEMEAAELYTLAAKYGRKALAVLTVSDNIATGEETNAEERQTSFNTMMEIALEAAIS